jgi:hypothetical protein
LKRLAREFNELLVNAGPPSDKNVRGNGVLGPDPKDESIFLENNKRK